MKPFFYNLQAIQAVLWNEEAGCWLDYDLINEKPRDYFVPTNLSPLWVKAYNISDSAKISESVLSYIEKNKLDKFPGGVPNTLYPTGEQWDFPNVWAPMQYILVEGLDNLGTPEAKELSKRWGYRWVKSNFEAYRETLAMFEKVSCGLLILIIPHLYNNTLTVTFQCSTTRRTSADTVAAVNTACKKASAGATV